MAGRRPGVADWLAIAAGLTVFGYAGWDGALWDPRWQLLLHLLVLGSIAGLVVIGFRGGELPRTRIDLPILGLLAAYALATVTAQNPGLAMRATASVVAFAAMLPAALVVLRHRPTTAALVVIAPTLVLAAAGLALLLARRIEWYAVGAPGLLPPVRLAGEGTPFGSVAVAPFVLLALLPLTYLIEPPRLRRRVQEALLAIAIPIVLLSGSRSAWLAIAAAGITLLLTLAWRRRLRFRLRWPRRWDPRQVAAVVGVVALGTVAVAFIAPRLTAVTSLIYRGNLWRDTLAAWSSNPALGIGPGTMPYARQAAAEPLSFPVRQPHSHNLGLGVLGDAGLVGLAAAVVLVGVLLWVVGPWRARTRAGLAAGTALVGLAVGGLFEDLTFLPNFNLLVILCAAIALREAGAVAWRPTRLGQPDRPVRLLAVGSGAAGGLVLLAVMVLGDAAAIAHRAGVDAAAGGAWPEATRRLARSAELDPWHPASAKALAVAADAAGDAALARRAAERAVALNGGDGPSWANLSLLCLRGGDAACATDAARRATDAATIFGREAVNAAFVHEALGMVADGDAAYRLSLAINRLTSLATSWPRAIDIEGVTVAEVDVQAAELNLLLARRAVGGTVDPGRFTDPAIRALAAEISGDHHAADAAIDEAMARQPTSLLTWEVALVVRAGRGEETDELRRIYGALRGSAVPGPDADTGPPGITFDIASFRTYPLDGFLIDAEHLQPTRPWPWALLDVLP